MSSSDTAIMCGLLDLLFIYYAKWQHKYVTYTVK